MSTMPADYFEDLPSDPPKKASRRPLPSTVEEWQTHTRGCSGWVT